MNRPKHSKIRLGLAATLLVTLTGCVYTARDESVYAPPPPDYVEVGSAIPDNYFYYPGYQVYYSSYRRQYIYQDGNAWVTRPAPPGVSVAVLFASPAVRLDFHDAPEIHHPRVIQQYPKHWKPPGENRKRGPENRNRGKGNDRGDRR
jgi:hypothetical protein